MEQETQQQPQQEVQKQKRRRKLWEWTNFGEKGLWDWLELLVIPAVLAVGGFLFSQAQDERQRGVEEQRAQEAALQEYINGIGSLLLDEDLRISTGDDEVSLLARARTLTVLNRLAKDHDLGITQENNDPQSLMEDVEDRQAQQSSESWAWLLTGAEVTTTDRRSNVLQFLKEAGLIDKEEPIISLADANLRGAFLVSAQLSGTDLEEANMMGAEMSRVDLKDADLSGAVLLGANLGFADLQGANLEDADLQSTNLGFADLQGANLEGAALNGTDLFGANLSGANLTDARVPEEELSGQDLKDATMPDGSKRG